MSYGLQISASGAFTALYRQDVYANNLANMDTVGFKSELPTTRPRASVREEDGVQHLPSSALLERLGAGVMMNPNRMELGQGAMRATGRDLDCAFQGEGYFAVKDASGPQGGGMLLTRDGRFARSAKGQLVMATTGLPVLDAQNRPIEIAESGKLSIDGEGTISQDGNVIAKLAIVNIPNPDGATRMGANLLKPTDSQLNQRSPATGSIRQGALEESTVDEVMALMDVTSASRDVDANIALIQQHDRLMERAIQSLGRTA